LTALVISGLAKVIITQASKQKLMIKLSGITIMDIITKVKNETLITSTKGFQRGELVHIFMNYNQLNRINISVPSESTGTNTLFTKEMNVTANVTGNFKDLAIEANKLSDNINRSGNARFGY
jgi:hypothetical protein